MVLPGVGDRDGHLDVLGAERFETQVADDPLTATLALDGDQTFTVYVIGATERPGRTILDPAGPAMEPRVATVRRQLRVEPLERHHISGADRPDHDARRESCGIHGMSVPARRGSHEGRTARRGGTVDSPQATHSLWVVARISSASTAGASAIAATIAQSLATRGVARNAAASGDTNGMLIWNARTSRHAASRKPLGRNVRTGRARLRFA